eukprot:3414070-Pleurochrysis_carterae.AAC.1
MRGRVTHRASNRAVAAVQAGQSDGAYGRPCVELERSLRLTARRKARQWPRCRRLSAKSKAREHAKTNGDEGKLNVRVSPTEIRKGKPGGRIGVKTKVSLQERGVGRGRQLSPASRRARPCGCHTETLMAR